MTGREEGRERERLTKRDELLFLSVFALPKDSNNGFDSKKISFTLSTATPLPATAAMYYMEGRESRERRAERGERGKERYGEDEREGKWKEKEMSK